MAMSDLPGTRSTPVDEADAAAAESWFRDGAAPFEALAWWRLDGHATLVDALRGLFHGTAAQVRLRLWVFVELMALPQARHARDALNLYFHALRDDALDLALRRLRELGLLAWDAGTQEYTVPALATQVLALLAPLAQPSADADGDELAGLLAQVAGAQQLGLVQPEALRQLQAQLARLHDEFAEAIASSSEFRLRQARRRFDRALALVERGSQALTAIIGNAHGEARLERVARDLGLAQARLLAMASQFNRALQQADRSRVTLGSTGINSTDVRRWLQGLPDLAALLDAAALACPAAPVFVSGPELLDVAEAEFQRDKQGALAEPLPPPVEPQPGTLEGLALPRELQQLLDRLGGWSDAHPVADALLPTANTRYAQAAYQAQLLPLLGDGDARELKGATGDAARLAWRAHWGSRVVALDHAEVAALSEGWLAPDDAAPPAMAQPTIPEQTE